MGAKGRTNPPEVFERVAKSRAMLFKNSKKPEVSSLESLSLTITGDSRSLFRKAYFKPKGRGLSTMVGFISGVVIYLRSFLNYVFWAIVMNAGVGGVI
jgi:hypothetical protein